jgi:hypothetical protein
MENLNKQHCKIAILTRPDFRSPRILAESLKLQIEKTGATVTIFFSLDVLTRLKSYNDSSKKVSWHFWLRKKFFHFLSDWRLLNKLKSFDAIIVSECSPNGFWRDHYQVEKLRSVLNLPVLYYEVYYLGNAPTQLEKLIKAGDATFERYNWHLAVSNVTEVKVKEKEAWSCIGLDLTSSGLYPTSKKEFIALVDFQRKGYEHFNEEQLLVLNELGIKTVQLTGNYTLDEIRNLYKAATFFFIQFPEAFGLPIAECLACGVQIFTPDSAWPMSWRLDENPEIHKGGVLPDVFTVYNNKKDLKSKLIHICSNYDLKSTPLKVFETFIKFYPHYYYGNEKQVMRVLNRIKDNDF